MTRLADFILANREPILAEWEAFARTCAPAGGTMAIAALRDHADAMLSAIAADLTTAQTRLAQSEKSKGRAHGAAPDVSTAAGEHGAGRAASGFTVEQMVAEYRALRASVIRLWTRAEGALGSDDVDDLTRFNEAIDQSLAESVAQYDEGMERAKETFLAVLGHDLRTPLAAIYSSATFMLETGELDEPYRTLMTRIAGSAKRTVTMVGDLLDFTRSRLGGGIPVVRVDMNLAKVVHDVVDEISAAHPGCRIRVDTRGEQRGDWDAARLSQALGNLIGNAVQHGAEGTTVTVDISGDPTHVTIAVHNRGALIPSAQLDGLFNPMKTRRSTRPAVPGGPTGSLGLGLYIAERIVTAHHGAIAVESDEAAGTTFTVSLPRHEARVGRRPVRTSAHDLS
ncbi:ATP-binding region ATPase domain protein (plasmid) [Gemmatirosa kalamazoonensis]|uniref:histidine kinase n=1 Tax=Gemmatirosa kalamazoonensis TaxID=861299 RepID=W0RSR0_9BACT|nr:sensor histidine kinase [Gemmatirosa kalamazoonensis]AHG93706.1 ATP-binding region ATPase domain protein [Gemmatirosa kalamazoonensis]